MKFLNKLLLTLCLATSVGNAQTSPRMESLDRPNLRASEGAGTTTLTYPADKLWQSFNLSAARTTVLPSTNIVIGQRLRFDNSTFFDLTIKSSDTTTITMANAGAGSHGDPTIQKGYVELIALQAAPTTPGHWRVMHVEETGGVQSGTTSGAITVSYQLIPTRIGSQATIYVGSATASAGANTDITVGPVAGTRYWPPVTRSAAARIQSANVPQSAVVLFMSDGTITYRRSDGSNHTGVSGVGGTTTAYVGATYLISP